MNKFDDNIWNQPQICSLRDYNKSWFKFRVRKNDVITITDLCDLVVETVIRSVKRFDLEDWDYSIEELDELNEIKWTAQKIINKHDRFNETGQRGYYLYHFNNLRDLLDLEDDWAILMFEGDVSNLPESVMKAFEDVSIETKIKSIIAQDIEPQPKENETH